MSELVPDAAGILPSRLSARSEAEPLGVEGALEPVTDLFEVSPEPEESAAPTVLVTDADNLEPTVSVSDADNPEPLVLVSDADNPPKKSRTGRNLPAAVGVGVGLLALLALTLAFRPEPFVVLVAVAISAGIWEMKSALEHANLQIAVWPLLAGTSAMVVAAFLGGIGALLTTFILTLLAIVIWQIVLAALEHAPISRLNIMASIFAAAYLPFFASFIILIMRQHQAAPYWRVALLILLCVANDTGGYFAGIFLGKHPMALPVSPKKSWEGFAGSVLLTCLVGIFGTHWVLGLPFTPNLSLAGGVGEPGALWLTLFGSALGLGLLLGVFTAITSTLGDLSESLIKRDLGIKDMGSILPGHGGILDRVDSIIFSAPLVFLILSIASQFTYPSVY